MRGHGLRVHERARAPRRFDPRQQRGDAGARPSSSQTRKRKLIQPGEITSVARTCRRTMSA
ncbi:MAG: hypothetical protein MZU84_04480 [Sphingobacterium sp.]|nr:hypothetical protein [Sphingobacterium sp.]